MPRKKKTALDSRDALEVLREAFMPVATGIRPPAAKKTRPARVAELGMLKRRRVLARTVASKIESPGESAPLGREPITSKDLEGPAGAKRLARNVERQKDAEDELRGLAKPQETAEKEQNIDANQETTHKNANEEHKPFNTPFEALTKQKKTVPPAKTTEILPSSEEILRDADAQGELDISQNEETIRLPGENKTIADTADKILQGGVLSPEEQEQLQKESLAIEKRPQPAKTQSKEGAGYYSSALEQSTKAFKDITKSAEEKINAPLDLDKKRESFARELAKEFFGRETPTSKKTGIEMRVRALLEDTPNASEAYKTFVKSVGERAKELSGIKEAPPLAAPETEPITPASDDAETSRWEGEGGALPPAEKTVTQPPAEVIPNKPEVIPESKQKEETVLPQSPGVINLEQIEGQLQKTTPQQHKEHKVRSEEEFNEIVEQAKETIRQKKDLTANLSETYTPIVNETPEQEQDYEITKKAQNIRKIGKAKKPETPRLSPDEFIEKMEESAKEAEKIAEKEEEQEKLSKREEKIKALQEEIDKTGGNAKQRQEHYALLKAKKHDYDINKVNARIQELEKEAPGLHAVEKSALLGARALLEKETQEKTTRRHAAETEKGAGYKIAENGDIELDDTIWKTAESAVEGVETEPKPPRAETVYKEIPPAIVEAFNKRLGISHEELSKETVFRNLSEGQQLLILQDLEQLALGRVQSETEQALAKKHTPEARWAATLWQSAKEAVKVGKKYRVEKRIASDITKGGMEQHGNMLKLLSAEMNPNLEVIPQKDNSLDVHYVSIASMEELLHKLPAKEQNRCIKYINSLNTTASEFRTMPLAWSSDTASSKQRRAYGRIQKRFHTAENNLLKIVGNATQVPLERAKYELLLAQTENIIQQEQFLNTHPEARIQLQTMTDKKWYTRHLQDIFKERAIFMATGSIARTATIGVAGVASLPITAAAIGGVMAGRALLRGHMATKKGRESLLHKSRAKQESKKEGEHMRDFTSSEALNKGFEKIIKKLNSFDARDNMQPLTSEERKEKEHALQQLEHVLYTTQQRQAEGAIAYGSRANMLPEHFRLGRNVCKAEQYLVTAPLEGLKPKSRWPEVDTKKALRAIENVWALRKSRMANERKAYLRKQALMQSGINAASGAFGMWISDTLELGPKIQNLLEKTIKKTGSLTGVDINYILGETEKKLTLAEPPESLPVAPSPPDAKNIDIFEHSRPTPSRPETDKGAKTEHAPVITKEDASSPAKETLANTDKPKAEEGLAPPSERITATIRKGGNIWDTAKEAAEKVGMSKKEFSDTWMNSTVTIDGKETPISKAGLSFEGNTVTAEKLKDGGYRFHVEQGEGKPIGTDKDITRVIAREETSPTTPNNSIEPKGERLLDLSENKARKMYNLNLDNYEKVRDKTIGEFLKKPPRGKMFNPLKELLDGQKIAGAKAKMPVGEFLKNWAKKQGL
jgi:hypothetical protein